MIEKLDVIQTALERSFEGLPNKVLARKDRLAPPVKKTALMEIERTRHELEGWLPTLGLA
mgnify:CR=1 FL=1